MCRAKRSTRPLGRTAAQLEALVAGAIRDRPRSGESAGDHFRPGELPLLDMYLTGVTLRVARDNVRAHLPDALGAAASGTVTPGKAVSHVIDREDLPAALPEKHLKPVFRPGRVMTRRWSRRAG